MRMASSSARSRNAPEQIQRAAAHAACSARSGAGVDASHASAARPCNTDAEALRDAAFGALVALLDRLGLLAAGASLRCTGTGSRSEIENAFGLARGTSPACGATASRQAVDEVEIVAELGAFRIVLLALDHRRGHGCGPARKAIRAARRPAPDLRKRSDEDEARAFQRGCDVGNALVGRRRRRSASVMRRLRRIGQQAVGQRLQPGFARDLRLGAALRLVRQVEVFEARLGVGVRDLAAQFASSACPAPRCSPATAARRSSSSRR
jgi:hypothetical protein